MSILFVWCLHHHCPACPDNVGFMESACNHPQVVLYERNAADELEIRTDAGQCLKAPGTSRRFQFSTWEPDPVQVRHCLEGCWSAVPNAQQFHSLGFLNGAQIKMGPFR